MSRPTPLLVWDLKQRKLIHDLRIAGHEFYTKMAGMTQDGQYFVTVAKVFLLVLVLLVFLILLLLLLMIIHDLRIAGHEFYTKMADITQDGQYFVTVAKVGLLHLHLM